MPKRTSGMNKAQRMAMVRRAIERNSEASIYQILEFFKMSDQIAGGSETGRISDDTLRRRIYEDIRDLVAINEIQEHDFGEVEEETGRRRRTYTLPGTKTGGISGINHLRFWQSDLITPSGTKIPWEVSCMEGCAPPEEQVRVTFQLLKDTIILRLLKDDLPVKLVIGRSQDSHTASFPKDDFIRTFGKRSSYLSLPFGGLNSKGANACIGHAVLNIEGDGTVSVKDLGTANHTEIASQVPMNLTAQLYGIVFGDMTLGYKLQWWNTLSGSLQKKFATINEERQPLPAVAVLAKSHSFVVYGSEKPSIQVIEKAAQEWDRPLNVAYELPFDYSSEPQPEPVKYGWEEWFKGEKSPL